MTSASGSMIDEASCRSAGVGAEERVLIEAVRDVLANDLYPLRHAGDDDTMLRVVIDTCGERIGELLRRLNARGLYL